ncbi:MAG: YvcK family protein [Desulfitobacteriaceae bacterium]|nr:YvcK family protein [Desulfitobacteriaceae bacterium]MDD4753368.1 YvcK family protein [Desulfitobacteriaceae bacterium]
MTWLKWFYPGIGIKRWLAVIICGLFLAAEGLAIAGDTEILNLVERQLQSFVSGFVGGPSRLVVGTIIVGTGFFVVYFGFRRLINNILDAVSPENGSSLGEVLFQNCQLKKGPKIVAIGGGTGLSTLLRGLKEVTGNITAIVAVTDDGGSSGRLRGNLNMPPPGDIRNCLVALADTENAMEGLFNYRFAAGSELEGHSLGNLLIAGLTQTTGDFATAVQEASRVLAVRGSVLPVTLDNVALNGEMNDGRVVSGETSLVADPGTIKRVFLEPRHCKPLEAAVEAILAADAVILGPGSLYTSIIPNLLVPGIAQAIKQSRAEVYYLCNIMTQPGETDGYKVSHHIKAIIDHCGMNIIDKVVVNKDEISKKLRSKYKEKGAEPVILDTAAVREIPVEIIKDSLSSQSDYARHDPMKLVDLLCREVQGNAGVIIKKNKTFQ